MRTCTACCGFTAVDMGSATTHTLAVAKPTPSKMPTPQPDALPHHTCPLCGGPNGCAPAQTGSLASACWCKAIKISPDKLAAIPRAQRGLSCICQACATADVAVPTTKVA